uniref:Nucleolar complex protein 2 homolog n=2 Tax=Schistocephalus solidus TaxID=70667 RepID=A0A0X3NZP3_SCHSO
MGQLKAMLEESILDLRKILNHIGKFSKYPKLLQSLLKKMCVVWSQDDDSRRVLALIILMKAVKKNPDYFSSCSRGMYLVYVKSSKFIYGSNIGKNNFMKNGLLELYSLDLNEAYKHAFVFIRQLAITVRKAFLRASKEDTRAVYNWQFICSLRFWSEFVSRNANSSELVRTLVHPLVQVILGTVSLSPGSRWIALRFHCVECLHILAGVVQLRNRFSDDGEPAAGTAGASSFGTSLVPSLPLLLDVFRLFDFNKRSSMASSAPMDLRLMLHFSPSQRRETACLDAVCSWLHDFLTESLTLYAGSVAFPEYSLPAVTEMRAFLKTCRVANFTRNFKVLVKKVKEHADFVKKRRSCVKNLTDSQAITAVEAGLTTASDSPLFAYYAIHRKARVLELTALAERFKNEDTALDAEDHKSAKKTKERLQKKSSADARIHEGRRGGGE